MNEPPDTVHATAVAIGGHGILIRGAAGSGKSSLALRLMEHPVMPAALVADDRVVLAPADGRLKASPPGPLEGLIEVRGVGVIAVPFVPEAAIVLIVELLPEEACVRLPDEAERTTDLLGVAMARLTVPIDDPAGDVRVHAALRNWIGG